ncbi:MAG: hypothetical protein HQM10_24630 [Candidatus Riflebacteria bacterium]|nr:hypothetical protein [Candidatus Riflebacteria bacterium]
MKKKSDSISKNLQSRKLVLDQIAEYLKEYSHSFFQTGNEIEIQMKGMNLPLRAVVSFNKGKLSVTYPEYIISPGVFEQAFLLELLSLMSKYDVHFSINTDNASLSASLSNIIGKRIPSKNLFFDLLIIPAIVVDDTYPQLMKLIQKKDSFKITKHEKIEVDGIQKIFEAGKSYAIN